MNLYYYGGGFDLLAALAAKALPFTVFESRRLMGAVVGLLGLFVTWRTGRRIGGPLAGLIALILLAACPLYYGHMFMNAKDSPFAVAMAFFLLGLVRAFDEYPRPRRPPWRWSASASACRSARASWALSVRSRRSCAASIFAGEARRGGIRPAGARVGLFLLALAPAMLLAYAVMALVWPWSVIDPLNPFRAIEYFSHFFEKPWEELFGGRLISVPDMPRSYVPTLLALKLPEIFFLLGFGGAAGALVAAFRLDIAAQPSSRPSAGRAGRAVAACSDDRAAAGDV